MAKLIIGYCGAALAMLVLDIFWLKTMAPLVYRPHLGAMLADDFRPVPAVLFYLLYLIGIVIFAISPALISGQLTDALIKGALFGFFAYATYDLTNHATLKIWSTSVTLIDMAWGTFLTAVSAGAGYWATTFYRAGA